MVRTQIQLTEEQARELRRLASERGLAMAELVRQAVDEMLRSIKEITPAERRKRAFDAAGRFHSGLRDLSEKHDEYLDEDFAS